MAEAAPETTTESAATPARWIAWARLGIGLGQGIGLWLLSEAATHKVWPSDVPALYGALVLLFAFVPLIVIGGLGRIRLIPLGVWKGLAAVALAIFAWHDMDAGIWTTFGASTPRMVPAFQVFFFSAVFIFVGHHLVGPADEARRPIAPYPSYFDWAWKDGVQVALSLAFVAVLWGALALGAALFNLIGIHEVEKLIAKPWIALPATCVAFAAAVQLTDVRVGLIRGVRTVGLVLLSWLLPVMTVLVVAFLAALPFTGLGALFGAGSSARVMLSASAALIILVSAAYQDGEAKVPVVLRWAGRAAGLALIPMTLITADALWLRINQYGLTPPRIEAVACAIVAAGFAAGYGFAAVRRKGAWMKPLELTNVFMARAVMLVILLMFTPIADPARLAVGDQVSRLEAGKTDPAKFDFSFLRFQAGRYGADALARLQTLKGSPANLALAKQARDAFTSENPGEMTAKSFAERLTVYPTGATVPPSFTAQDWGKTPPDTPPGQVTPACYWGGTCEAYVLDIDGDKAPEVLIAPGTVGPDRLNLDIFRRRPDGLWISAGQLVVFCADAVADLRAGHVTLTPKTGVDLVIAGRRQRVDLDDETPCAAAKPTPPAAAAPTERQRVSPMSHAPAMPRP
jgi:hypothetical protein